jgi:hypothetical protein
MARAVTLAGCSSARTSARSTSHWDAQKPVILYAQDWGRLNRPSDGRFQDRWKVMSANMKEECVTVGFRDSQGRECWAVEQNTMCGAPCSRCRQAARRYFCERHIPTTLPGQATITTEQSVRSYRLERPAGSHVSNTSWTQVPEKPRPVPTSGAPGGRSQDHTSPVVVIPNTTQRVDPSTMSSGGIEVVEGNTYNTRQLAIKAFADGVTSSLSCKSNPRAQMPGYSAARHRLPSSPSTKRRRLGVP